MNSIAYVDHQGVLNLIDGDGSSVGNLSGETGHCSWPNWSPDGGKIAFSSYRPGGVDEEELAIHVFDVVERRTRPAYVNDFDTGDIAPRVPHYAMWSPDGHKLAFVAQTSDRSLTLFVDEIDTSDPPRRIMRGGPLYCTWGPDSSGLLVHSFQDHYMVDLANEYEVRQFPGPSTLYMAPAWNADDGRAAMFLDSGDNRQRLVILGLRNPEFKVVLEIAGIGACSWQPGGTNIALVRDMRGRSGFYDGLWLVNPERGTEDQIIQYPVLAFFWSPDGSRIAYVTTSETGQGSLRWAVQEIDSGETVYLADFRPTQENLISFMYFDQYAKSNSPWSPDGSRLLFAGVLGHQEVRAALPEGEANRIYTAPSSGAGPPEEIAGGFIACWGRR